MFPEFVCKYTFFLSPLTQSPLRKLRGSKYASGMCSDGSMTYISLMSDTPSSTMYRKFVGLLNELTDQIEVVVDRWVFCKDML